jgi:GNAT superfamily N-acetyltransferase
MNEVLSGVGVSMVRHNLENIPNYSLPEPYTIRWYQTGDDQAWLRIEKEAEKKPLIKDELFDKEFGDKRELLPDRLFFICDGNSKEIGTTTAWFYNNPDGKLYGLVHWVAIVPSEQGKGLGNFLMMTVCNRLKELGYEKALLNTSTARIPAINLYLKFGFVPEIKNDKDKEIWDHVRTILNSSKR